MVPSHPRRKDGSQGSAALDRPLPELEPAVRSLPFDPPQERLRRGQRQLQDDVQRDQRRLRGLSRPGFAPHRLGEAGPCPLCSRRRQGPGGAEVALEGGLVVCDAGRPVRAARPPRRRSRRQHLRGLPRAPLDAGRARRDRCAPAGHPSPGPADPAHVFRRRAAARRSLRLEFVPADAHAPEGRDLHGLPRRAFAQAADRWQHAVRTLPQRGHFRRAQAPRAQSRQQGRPVRRMPHARAQLHGGRCPARPRHPRATPRPERQAGHARRLHPLPRRPQAAMGRSGHGRVVRHRLARTATDRQHPARRRDPGRVRPALAHGAGGRSHPGADLCGRPR
jgi:hypothetical protein